MSYDPRFDQNSWPRPAYGGAGPGVDVDLGLRRYMLQVYNFMAAGLGVTGLVAYAASDGAARVGRRCGPPWAISARAVMQRSFH